LGADAEIARTANSDRSFRHIVRKRQFPCPLRVSKFSENLDFFEVQ
jgi:hypothetical protein